MNPMQGLNVLRGLGLPGVVGVLGLALALWMHLAWAPQLSQQVDAMGAKTNELRRTLKAQQPSLSLSDEQTKPFAGMSEAGAWQSMWQSLPDESQKAEMLGLITKTADKLSVQAASVQYRGASESWSQHEGQALWRERISLPVEGRYADVRAWLGTLLSQPYVSLDVLDVNRPDTTSDLVKARVNLSMWWKVSQP